MKTAVRFLLPVLLAVVCVAQVRRSSELTKAQHLLWSVERRTLAILRGGAIDKVKLTGNIAALTDAQKLDPAEVAIPTLIGSEYLARSAYFAAHRLEPRPEILLNLGKVGYSQGWHERAAHFFAQAVLLDPRMMKEVPEDFRARVSDALRSQDDADGANEN